MTTPSSPVCNESSDDITGRVTRSGNLYVSPCHLPAPLLLLLPHLFLLRCGQALLCTMQFPENRGEREAVRNPVVVGCLLLPNITTPSQIIFITLSSGVHCLSYWMTLLMSNMDRTVITTQNLSNLPKFVRLLRL